jgi:NAD(P)-dependent dehydrogenase (short-subunit alcohol dehydrogenase family)
MQLSSLFQLNSSVVIVTGGAGLYGAPISMALAAAGATVVIASRNVSECKLQAEKITAEGYSAYAYALDLSVEKSIQDFVEQVIEHHGKIDVLVNNAVSRQGFKNLEDVTKEEWEQAQLVNSTGLMLITQAVLKHMCLRQSGNIINISSIQGAVGPHFPVYGDTGMSSPVNYTYDKWGMVGFTKWIANYYGKYNIRANCISPGGYGPGVAAMPGDRKEFIENYKRLTPLGRFAEDEDMMGPVVFLASAASAYITGHNLMVDGGWTSW